MGSESNFDELVDKLGNAITEFDGKSPSILSEAEAKFSNHQSYLEALIALSTSDTDSVSSGATWLLKSKIEEGTQLSPDQVVALIQNIRKITDWSARLHICQTLHVIPISSESLPSLLYWLCPLTSHKRPFVRAWAISVFCSLTSEHSVLLGEAKTYLADARDDPAASVRARVRNITLD